MNETVRTLLAREECPFRDVDGACYFIIRFCYGRGHTEVCRNMLAWAKRIVAEVGDPPTRPAREPGE